MTEANRRRWSWLPREVVVAVGAIAAVLGAAQYLHGWLEAGVIVLGVLTAIGSVIALVERDGFKRAEAEMRRRFPGYADQRLPIGDALLYEAGANQRQTFQGDRTYWLGVSTDELFLIANERKTEFPWRGGALVNGPDGKPIAFSRRAMGGINLEILDQARIEEAARDKRDLSEKLAEGFALKLTGLKAGKIVPYAAYLEVIVDTSPSAARLISAFPTDIDAKIVEGLKLSASSSSLAEKAVGAVADAAVDAAVNATDKVVGGGLVSLGGDMYDFATGLDRPSGSTKSEASHAVARLVAGRLRQLVMPSN